MNKMVVTTTMIYLLGFFIKNNGHWGLIIPKTKKSIVIIPKSIAPGIMNIYLLNCYLNGFTLLLGDFQEITLTERLFATIPYIILTVLVSESEFVCVDFFRVTCTIGFIAVRNF